MEIRNAVAREKSFIDESLIRRQLKAGRKRSTAEIRAILVRAGKAQGIEPEEGASLLQVQDSEVLVAIFQKAREIKEKIYGKRLVLFAPLYLSNDCVNNCLYCGFRRGNQGMPRKRLTGEEISEQVRALESLGHKRLLLECGESPLADIDFVEEAVARIYATKQGNGGEIRRVNVNIAATTVDHYRRLKAAKIGTYQLFQETYHRPTYEKLHEGPKKDYERQLFAHDRAQEAGIDDVGLGVLFGLYDYPFEVLGLLHHARHLEERFGVGPHTISVPRWRPAPGIRFQPAHPVRDQEFQKLIAVLRLALPYTGMIISTRESEKMRTEAFRLGISQTSAGSCTAPGGYGKGEQVQEQEENGQFQISDRRSPDEVIRSICDLGYLPSFCTACYRRGRTGKEFMDLAKPGNIQELCNPNALLTFKEYLQDYAQEETRIKGSKMIRILLESMTPPTLRQETERRLKEIEEGKRDLYF